MTWTYAGLPRKCLSQKTAACTWVWVFVCVCAWVFVCMCVCVHILTASWEGVAVGGWVPTITDYLPPGDPV